MFKAQIMNYGIGGKISLHFDTFDKVGGVDDNFNFLSTTIIMTIQLLEHQIPARPAHHKNRMFNGSRKPRVVS